MRAQMVILALFLVLILIPKAGAVEVIQRTEQPGNQGMFSSVNEVFAFFGANWIWLLIIGAVAIIGLWLMKYMNAVKERQNVFLRYYKEVQNLCRLQKNHKRVRERMFWVIVFGMSAFMGTLMLVIALVTDDVSAFTLSSSIFIAGIVISAGLKFGRFFAQHDIIQIIGQFGAKIVGWYEGECVTADGYRNFMVSNGRKYLFWKHTFILRVNLNDKLRVETRNQKGKREFRQYILPKDLIIEGENVIAIKGEGVDKANYFFYPLVADEQGNIINMDLIAYARAREVAMLDTLYQQTEDFARVQREAININPNVRYKLKAGGESVGGTGMEG